MKKYESIKNTTFDFYNSNKEIALNIIGAFGVRGVSLILSLFTMPVYIRYFRNQSVLGIWYTLLSVLNWVLMFDLGLGNGLRNKLPICLAKNKLSEARSYIVSTYVMTLFIVLVWSVIGNMLIPLVNWNSILNIHPGLVSNEVLISCIKIVFLGIMVQFVFKLITSILYAVQKSAAVNVLTLISTIIILLSVSFLPVGTIQENLLRMSWINAIAVNLPLLIATIFIFSTTLKKVIPKIQDFRINFAKEVLHIGVTLLWLQLIFMVISNTNEFLISHLTNPESVVQYQAYNKIFNTVSSILTLGLTPIWSAVTKAAGQNKYEWIKKLNLILLLSTIGVLIFELLLVPFMQPIVNTWLGRGIVSIRIKYSVIFAISNAIFFLHNVNTSFGNGMSFFKIQVIWMTFAAIVDIPLSYLFANVFGGWIGIIVANIVALLPFEVIQIIYFKRLINEKIQANKACENDREIKWINFKKNTQNLLIYAHYYHPDVASTGQILKELCEGMLPEFNITVICVVPSYEGGVSVEYKTEKYYFEEIKGVNIIRVRVPEFSKTNKISRIKNIVTYFIRALMATFKSGKQDYVYAISQPPVLGGLLGVCGKWIKHAKYIYNIQDFNPEQVMAVNYSKNRLILNLMMWLDKFSCKKADKVIVVGRDMVDTLKGRFKNKKVPNHTFINNWIDESNIYPLEHNEEHVVAFKRKYGLEDKFIIMYSGNIGLYYDLENLIRIIKNFKDEDNVVFAFVGAGSIKDKLILYKEQHNLENVVFIPYQDKNHLIYSLNAGDVHWVVNAKGIKGVSVPSKLYGVMAAGKPILGVLDKDSEARLIIEETGCGLVAEPGDYKAVEENIRRFIETAGSQELAEMGALGREYLECNLTKDVSVKKYINEIINI